MRVISGSAGGIRLKTKKHKNLRPTRDLVKESLYNILGKRVFKACMLDLFAGSGSIGIEGLSRGLSRCIFIDIDQKNIKLIKSNLKKTDLYERAEVYRNNAVQALNILKKRDICFDLIFCDPPYNSDLYRKAAYKIVDNEVLINDGLLIFEHQKNNPVGELPVELELIRSESYGQTMLSFLKISSKGKGRQKET